MKCIYSQTGFQFSHVDIHDEWNFMSQSNTRKVYNFGIGSLFSYASRQDPNIPDKIAALIPSYVDGIVRIFGYCAPQLHNFVAASAVSSNEQDSSTFGAFFEIKKEQWPAIREREKFYKIKQVSPRKPYPKNLEKNAFYFVWGDENEEPCPRNYIVSQAYWDFMIGGILSWDGQITDSGRYIWDIEAEIKRWNITVHQWPTISFDDRFQYAVELVKTTHNTHNYKWGNDRLCPFTFNTLITPKEFLRYPSYVLDHVKAPAIGTVSPPFSQFYFDLVDKILVKAGLQLSDRQPIDCNEVEFSRSLLKDLYYDELLQWRKNSFYTEYIQWGVDNKLYAVKEKEIKSANKLKKRYLSESLLPI